MSQETIQPRDPIEEYHEIYNRQWDENGQLQMWVHDHSRSDPWSDGRYAVAAIVVGLIVMLLLSVPAGASGTAKKPHPGTKVNAFVKEVPRPKCLDPVRVVGSQDIREDAAEASAKKAWSEMVRWQHGESFQDFELAQGYSRRCSRSSIGEALGQYFSRCEIEAQPCRAGMTKADKP